MGQVVPFEQKTRLSGGEFTPKVSLGAMAPTGRGKSIL
jgi:hypothetical protein